MTKKAQTYTYARTKQREPHITISLKYKSYFKNVLLVLQTAIATTKCWNRATAF